MKYYYTKNTNNEINYISTDFNKLRESFENDLIFFIDDDVVEIDREYSSTDKIYDGELNLNQYRLPNGKTFKNKWKLYSDLEVKHLVKNYKNGKLVNESWV